MISVPFVCFKISVWFFKWENMVSRPLIKCRNFMFTLDKCLLQYWNDFFRLVCLNMKSFQYPQNLPPLNQNLTSARGGVSLNKIKDGVSLGLS